MNASLNKTPMSVQDRIERRNNFREVALGYTEEEAVAEAERCLGCKNRPCTEGCPVGVAVPDFLALIKERRFEEAYAVVAETNCLPAVCGRVCPQERQCEGRCVRGIKGEPVGIGRLERFVADRHAEHGKEVRSASGKRVAVVGSGPAGLACAGELARRGYRVTVFEALHALGGVLVYGIPPFRLPKEIVAREIDALKARGVEFLTDAVIGRTYTVEELRAQFAAVFLGTGAGLPKFMGIKGENACGVFSANEYLTRVNLMKAYEKDSETPVFRAKKAAVVGGGNVAMDAARTAKRLGAEVTVVYHRSKAELPARREEIEHAEEEGIAFCLLSEPKEVLTDKNGNCMGLLCAKMILGEPDDSGRRRPVETEERFVLEADCVIMALGTSPNPLIERTTAGLETCGQGRIAADEDGKTSLKGVFAGGDAVTGSATVILAMGAGKHAAIAIDKYLSEVREI